MKTDKKCPKCNTELKISFEQEEIEPYIAKAPNMIRFSRNHGFI